MYRVLIADDEPSVAGSLKESIAWQELGLEVAGILENGKEVLAFLEREPVDILILDIRMPGLNGLEVCERLHETREKLQIILISGYAEFSYAERAIRYGVLGYCLKPLEYDKVTQLLLKAEKNCEKWNREAQEVDLLEAVDRNDTQALREKMRLAQMEEGRAWVLVSTGGGKLSFESPFLMLELGREQYGYLCREPVSPVSLECMRQKEEILGIGYTKEAVCAEEISRAFKDCQTKAFQYFVNPRERLCGELDAMRAVPHLEGLQELITKKKWDSVIETLQKLEKDGFEDFTIRSALKLCNMIHNGNLFLGAENDDYVYSLRQLAADYGNIRRMFAGLCQDIEEAKNQQKPSMEYTNTAFLELMEYIEDHYKSDISLTSAAQHCHMSANYLSQLFKKETGMTFVHYVTQLRMEEALRLLRTTKKSAAEISAMVGFNDYFYFLKTFKKYTGKTLSQYRAEL
ncbi:MAG: response regulator [Eubacteriales bacterium]|nr:response regulator [Eubacteriales bacterium]